MPLRPGLKRGFQILLSIFAVLIAVLIGYSYVAIDTEISVIEKITLTLETGVNTILSSLDTISSLLLTETIFLILFFASSVYIINYLLNWYFIEKRHALVDELTEIYNRKAMKLWMKKEIQRAERFNHVLSVAMIDLDRFKVYNDKNGHVMGDYLLKSVAKIFKESTREIDFVGRYGGEEFIIIFPHTEHKDAVIVMERIRKKIETTRFHGREVMPDQKITVSVGLVTFHKNLKEERMIHEADELLYEAKTTGRNQVIHKKEN